MKELFKREVKRDGYDILINAGILLIAPFVLIIMCLALSDKMEQAREFVCTLQEPASLFFDFSGSILYSDYMVLLQVVIMVTNFIVVWNACHNTVYIMKVDEENGSIFYMCNQMYLKKDFAKAKYLYSVVHYVLTYVLWYIGMVVFAVISNIAGKRGLFANVGDMCVDMIIGVAVGLIFISLTFLYVSWTELREEGNYSIYIAMIVAGTVALANFYKIVDIIIWILDNRGIDAGVIEASVKKLEYFRYISPLSWTNPFADRSVMESVIYILVAVVVSLVALLIGVKKYEKRNLIF